MQESLGRKLRILRAERGISQEEAAARAGITPETLSRLEWDRRRAYSPTLHKIAKGYGIPVSELMIGEEEPVPLGSARLAGLLERDLGHSYILTPLADLREEAAGFAFGAVEVAQMLVALGDEVRHLKEVFLERGGGEPDLARAVQDAWRGAMPRAYLLASVASEKQLTSSVSEDEVRTFVERLEAAKETILQAIPA